MDNSSMISKIRGLLAKAESTEYGAEAEAFLDKATALMAQYRIDEAELVAAGQAQPNPVEKRTIKVTGYRACKDGLIVPVVRAFGCHVIRLAGGKTYGLVGGRSDLDMAVALFTSLEIQLDRELMNMQGYDTGSTRSMRANFAKGWVSTVGKRVTDRYNQQANDAEAAGSHSAALVLANRDEESAAKFAEWYHTKPRYTSRRETMTNGRYYQQGRQAGHSADVGGGKIGGTRGAIGY